MTHRTLPHPLGQSGIDGQPGRAGAQPADDAPDADTRQVCDERWVTPLPMRRGVTSLAWALVIVFCAFLGLDPRLEPTPMAAVAPALAWAMPQPAPTGHPTGADINVPDARTVFAGRDMVVEEPAPTF